MGSRNTYSDDEEILIIDLYRKTPTSEIRKDNPHIIELCDFFNSHGYNRTINGIIFKMENLKSVDPNYTSNGRAGLVNIRKRSKELWDRELETGFSELDAHAAEARAKISSRKPPFDQ